ncbi:MAG: acyl-CoA dehydrogenase family protein [Gammaproteobacteria bacterium]|nr:acyl-CoA dehydrogenase family protein [Gammaproteobacteria bacterium]MCP5200325.1 acyl-CoA dehydrogenase family protein [Gammaproteobacteria bacterium]
MNFDFDDTERAFQAAVRRYALERLLPDYARWDRGERLPRERVRELAELGLTGLLVSPDVGGVGGSYVQAGIAAEEIARGDHNMTFFIQLGAIAADLIGQYAQPALRDALLPRLASGEALVAFGLTEPGAGSDAASIRTRAERDDDGWVVSGEKASITLAGNADYAVVFARMGDGGARGIGALVVPLDAPGVSRQVYDAMGGKLAERGSLFFDAVRVPHDHQLGEPGRGFAQAMEAFDYNRAIIALACLGTAQQSLDETMAYARQRETFGKPLARHAGYAFQVAEHATHLASARLLAYQTLWLKDQGRPHTREAAMAKYLAPKAATEAIRACIVLNGWMGYDNSLPHAQRLRDVLGLEIGDGTPEIMKGVVARELFGREFVAYR